MATIRIGIGGWTFAPWRGVFYPEGLPHAQELTYASTHLTAIEINSTFYRHQSAASFASWRDQTPDGFVFTVKAHRATTHGSNLAEAGSSIERFLGSGLAELGPKLGPVLWQFPHTRRYAPEALASFLSALPPTLGSLTLRHAIEARHTSFFTPEAVAQLLAAGVAQVMVDSEKQPLFGDLTADFVYARLQRNCLSETEGYDSRALDEWAGRLMAWRDAQPVGDLPLSAEPASAVNRDVFAFFISGEKEHAPIAARAMLRRLSGDAGSKPR